MKKMILFLLIIFCIIWATLIEPNMLEVNTYNIKNSLMPHMKIVFIGDLHARKNQKKRVIKVVNKINEQHPDLVLSIGDFVNGYTEKDTLPTKVIANELSKVKSKYGFYTILGNHDDWQNPKQLAVDLTQNHIKVLDNSNTKINIENKRFTIAGLEDDTTGNPDLYKAFKHSTNPIILLMHSPDMYPMINRKTDLVLAGHNHGGQVCFPFLGPLYVPSKTGLKYAYGFFEDGYKKMIVTKGIGTSVLNVRFNCKPEIVVIKIN